MKALRDLFDDIARDFGDNPTGTSVRFFVCALIAGILLYIVVAVVDGLPRLTEGYVADKTHNAAYTTTETSVTNNGDGTRISTRPIHHPETWQIKVAGYEDDGAARGEWWEVGAGLYELIEIGDYVRRDGQTGTVSVSEKRDGSRP